MNYGVDSPCRGFISCGTTAISVEHIVRVSETFNGKVDIHLTNEDVFTFSVSMNAFVDALRKAKE